MTLPRPCERCKKRFKPSSRYNRICPECYKKSMSANSGKKKGRKKGQKNEWIYVR